MEYILETAHLRVRKFKPADAQRLYENHLEEEMREWFPNESYVDIAEAQAAIEFYIDCVDNHQLPYVLAIELKETGELIGDTGVNRGEGNSPEIEIGYSICKKHRGKGYATEVACAMTDYIIKTFGIHAIYGRVIRGNNASAKVLEKSGYAYLREELDAEDDPYGQGLLVYKKEC